MLIPRYNIIFCFLIYANVYPETATADIDSTKVYEGDIEVEIIKNVDGISGVKAVFTIDAKNNEIWGMLNDFDNYKEIYGGIDSLKILQEESSSITIEFWSDAVLKKINFTLHRMYDKKNYKITWENVAGDIEYIRGGWEIVDMHIENKKILVYQSYVQVKSNISSYLIRQGAKRKVRSMAKNLKEWIGKNKELYSQ